MIAADAISPIVTGRKIYRTDEKYLLSLNFSNRIHIHITIRNEGRTTAKVAVAEPNRHRN